jgi:GMP synthase (glutamine-hydrolysing)
MRPILIVTHLEDRQDGLVGECFELAGSPVLACNPYDRATVPALDEVAGVVSLGGRQSATQVDRDPFLAGEVALLAAALRHDVPVLGMCLGAQLLAVAAGGRVTAMGRMYAGWPELDPLPAASSDPVFGGLPSRMPVLRWHEDVIELPAGAIPLATAPVPGADLFRVGPAAWGSQAHLELTPAMLMGWLAGAHDVAEIQAAGHDIEEFRAESAIRLEAQMAASRPAFAAFAAIVQAGERERRRAPGSPPEPEASVRDR